MTQLSAVERIKQHHLKSLFVCFVGVVGCYSGYAYLQESLLADKSRKMNVSLAIAIQNLFAVLVSATIILTFKMGSLF